MLESDDAPSDIEVGSKVQLLFDTTDEGEWFVGRVTKIQKKRNRAYVIFEDGQEGWYDCDQMKALESATKKPPQVTKQQQKRVLKPLRDQDELMVDKFVSSDEPWDQSKKKIKSHQQEIRDARIKEKIDEKKELVQTVRESEEQKQKASQSSQALQAVAMTMMAKTLEKLMEQDKVPAPPQHQDTRIDALETEVKELKTSISALLQHFGINKPL